MRKIRIGLLIPYSGIFRNLRADFRQGLQLGLRNLPANYQIEFAEEFIQTGGKPFVEQALNKLLLFDNVDIVIGVAGTKVILQCADIFEKHRTPVIAVNLGGFVPTYQFRSDYLFHTSLELWKSEWVMGKWAQVHFGADPAVSLSYYEAGYNMHECYRYGLHAAGAASVKLNFISNMTTQPDTLPLINQLEILRPGHTHAMLSGKEATEFLYHYNQKNISSRTALTVHPFVTDECLESADPLAAGFYSAATWTYHLDTAENSAFKSGYESAFADRPNAYSMLAYECGLALSQSATALGQRSVNRESLAESLRGVSALGPRGNFSLKTTPYATMHPVYIRISEVSKKTQQLENRVVDQRPAVSWEQPDILEAAYQNTSGWQNPYLCV
ncbi:hypothetical protein C7T94_18420 [Pedobacter yulinensis]|uniref:Leucine-binding protein domain-containing protein n=1 Tax=Pedobacter yulinensis TaxID=2126353 RepID=A0A2T3HHD8_9SPHI|nr:ABC transporter substrate-binding protein [Pedobacter yulinensis]PST81842.1 hypothetical protein C7T94_18420 [Pedobacter yulinensis]